MIRALACLGAAVFLAACLPGGAEEANAPNAPETGYVFDDETIPAPGDTPEAGGATDASAEEDTARDGPVESDGPEDRETETALETLTATDEAPPASEPEAEKPDPNAKARRSCERKNGTLNKTQSGLFLCVQDTGQGLKSCTSGGQCKGECLARSKTCAPFLPMLGCHEVVSGEGGVSTVCIN